MVGAAGIGVLQDAFGRLLAAIQGNCARSAAEAMREPLIIASLSAPSRDALLQLQDFTADSVAQARTGTAEQQQAGVIAWSTAEWPSEEGPSEMDLPLPMFQHGSRRCPNCILRVRVNGVNSFRSYWHQARPGKHGVACGQARCCQVISSIGLSAATVTQLPDTQCAGAGEILDCPSRACSDVHASQGMRLSLVLPDESHWSYAATGSSERSITCHGQQQSAPAAIHGIPATAAGGPNTIIVILDEVDMLLSNPQVRSDTVGMLQTMYCLVILVGTQRIQTAFDSRHDGHAWSRANIHSDSSPWLARVTALVESSK